jgi:hypothetical protein
MPGGGFCVSFTATVMATIIAISEFAGRRPGLYLGGCFVLGSLLRLGLAPGDLGLTFSPIWHSRVGVSACPFFPCMFTG